MQERIIAEIPQDEMRLICGQRDEHLRLLREGLGVSIAARNEALSIRGEPTKVEIALQIINDIRSHIKSNGHVAPQDIQHWLRQSNQAPAGHPETPTVTDHSSLPEMIGPFRRVKAKTDGQAAYVEAIKGHALTLGVGPAGTGKTFLAVGAAVEALHSRKVRRIVLTRPAVEAGEKLGFLPGDLETKVNPYLRPLLDALQDMLDVHTVQKYLRNDIVEIVPLAFMRGRTLNDAFIILDEAQNTSVSQMRMFLTRWVTVRMRLSTEIPLRLTCRTERPTVWKMPSIA